MIMTTTVAAAGMLGAHHFHEQVMPLLADEKFCSGPGFRLRSIITVVIAVDIDSRRRRNPVLLQKSVRVAVLCRDLTNVGVIQTAQAATIDDSFDATTLQLD